MMIEVVRSGCCGLVHRYEVDHRNRYGMCVTVRGEITVLLTEQEIEEVPGHVLYFYRSRGRVLSPGDLVVGQTAGMGGDHAALYDHIYGDNDVYEPQSVDDYVTIIDYMRFLDYEKYMRCLFEDDDESDAEDEYEYAEPEPGSLADGVGRLARAMDRGGPSSFQEHERIVARSARVAPLRRALSLERISDDAS